MATLNKDQNEVKPLSDEELDQAAGGREHIHERDTDFFKPLDPAQ